MQLNKPNHVERMILNEIKYELTPKEEKNLGSLIKEKIFSIYMAFIHRFSSFYSEKKLRLGNEVINLYEYKKNEENQKSVIALKTSIELIKSGCNLKKILESKSASENNSVQELPKDIAQKEIEVEDLNKEIEINHDGAGVSDEELKNMLEDINFEPLKENEDTLTEFSTTPTIEELTDTKIVDNETKNEVSDDKVEYFDLEYDDYNVDADTEVESEGEVEYYDVNQEWIIEEENSELRADSVSQSNLLQLIETETLPSDSIENRSDPADLKTLSSDHNSSASTAEFEELDFVILGQDKQIESPNSDSEKLVEVLDEHERKFLFHLPPEMLELVAEQFKHQTKANRTEFINEYRRLNPPVPPVQKEMIDSINQAWGTVDQESQRLSEIWLTVLNPSGKNNDQKLIIEKWNLIQETKGSKIYYLEFKKECQGKIGDMPGVLTMPKSLKIEFTSYKGKKAISFPENQLSIPLRLGYLKQIRIKEGEIEINAGRGAINGHLTVNKIEDYEDVKSIASTIKWS